jgi:hypothetical protein
MEIWPATFVYHAALIGGKIERFHETLKARLNLLV